MKVWKNKLVAILFALAAVLFLVPGVVKPVVKGEGLDHIYLVLAFSCSVLAMILFAAARKSAGDSAV